MVKFAGFPRQGIAGSDGGEELIKIFFILLLICQLSQVTACDTDKYEHDGVCCSCLTRTQLNDTVCETCPAGTFSSNNSSTEACKNWTACEKLHRQLLKPGSSEADVKCAEANNNLRIIIPVIAIAVIILILIGAVVFWRHPELRPRCKIRRENGIGRGDKPSPAGTNINMNDSESTSMPLRSNEQP